MVFKNKCRLSYMNRFGPWKIDKEAGTKDDIFDPDFDPEKCNLPLDDIDISSPKSEILL